jgi:hypothetical protein
VGNGGGAGPEDGAAGGVGVVDDESVLAGVELAGVELAGVEPLAPVFTFQPLCCIWAISFGPPS